MASMLHLEIPRRQIHCFHKGEKLVPGMEVYSLLLDEDHQTISRRDYCSTCWKEMQEKDGAQTPIRGYWKSTIEFKKTFSDTSRYGRALIVLKELLQKPEDYGEEIFVLCLFLARGRQLVLRQEFEQEGMAYQLYEVLKEENFLTIKSFQLSSLEIEKIQQSMAKKISIQLTQ